MRKAFLAAMSLVTGMVTFYAAAAGPAAAEPARASSASAYGLSGSGLIAIAPTITTATAFPPGGDNNATGTLGVDSPSLITLPLGNLAIAGVVGVEANSHQADDINPTTATVPDNPPLSSPVTLAPDNTRALARTTGLGLVFTAPGSGEINPIATALALLPSLLTAEAVTSEAVAKCVDGQPVFDTGYQIAGLGGIVGGVLDPIVQAALDLVLGLVSGDPLAPAPLSSIIAIQPGVVTPLPDGVAIDGLRISVLGGVEAEGGLQDLIISHSEVHMAADCTVVAPPPDTTRPAGGAGGGGRLASTGTETPYLAVGMGLVVLAAIGGGVARRSRRAKVQ